MYLVEGWNLLKGFKARIYVEQDAKPKYFQAHLVLYLLKAKIKTKIKTKIKEQLDKIAKE